MYENPGRGAENINVSSVFPQNLLSIYINQ